MKRILIPSPVISEEKKAEVKEQLEKEKLSQKQKDKRRWEAYQRYLSKLKRKKRLVYGGLNTTK
jgi:hypothetical protein